MEVQKVGGWDPVRWKLMVVGIITIMWLYVARAMGSTLTGHLRDVGCPGPTYYGFLVAMNAIGAVLVMLDKALASIGWYRYRLANYTWFVAAFVGANLLSSLACYACNRKMKSKYLRLRACNVLFTLFWLFLFLSYQDVLFEDALEKALKDA